MKFTRIRTETQARHVGSRSKTHAVDKARGEARRERTYISVPAEPRPSPERTFKGVAGAEAILDPETGTWRVCKDKEELGDYLVAQSARLSRYQAWTSRHGRRELMARRDPSPLTVHTVSWHPAVSQMIADLLARGEGRDLPNRIFARWGARVPRIFEGKRRVVAIAMHLDSGDGHIDNVVTRNCGDGRIGSAGLGLVGPYMVAVDRQVRGHAVISATKRARYDRAMANFERREGPGNIPFDVQLARIMDQICDEVLGPAVGPYVDAYIASVPAFERAHALAKLREVDAARDKLLQEIGAYSGETEVAKIPVLQPPSLVVDTPGQGGALT
jgi:hypothetical protein